MSNPLIPRTLVHTWSEAIGNQQDLHSSAIQRLVRDQRRLSKFVEENAKSMENGVTGGVAVYLIGVVLRMFDLAGGRMRNVDWETVRAAEKKVGGLLGPLLPFDAGFQERARAVPRAQPHVLDEALYALFDRPVSTPEERPLSNAECVKVYLLLWVATEALDAHWTPPKGFEGPATYTFEPIA